ncbi:organomercurial lyase [Halorarum halobium]|uniref:organomercurial lyase n=1 Tax=Halorarum halobium TaxID=3075121 RepID=UPI0028AFE551|nr:organomercurial lyase [Halobaculum sp. XH14]
MSDSRCRCCDPTDAPTTDRPASTDRWLDERPAGDASLPPDVADRMNEFYGTSIGTIDEFVAATRVATGGGAIAREDLCHVEVETPHVARTAGERHHFRCFLDGIALAFIAEEPVEISTVSPSGAPIELDATPDGDVAATPSEAVMSLGIAADVATGDDTASVDDAATGDDTAHVDGAPAVEAVYGAVCPAVKAFPSREHYEGWAAGVDAATVGLPLPLGASIAAALTGER